MNNAHRAVGALCRRKGLGRIQGWEELAGWTDGEIAIVAQFHDPDQKVLDGQDFHDVLDGITDRVAVRRLLQQVQNLPDEAAIEYVDGLSPEELNQFIRAGAATADNTTIEETVQRVCEAIAASRQAAESNNDAQRTTKSKRRRKQDQPTPPPSETPTSEPSEA